MGAAYMALTVSTPATWESVADPLQSGGESLAVAAGTAGGVLAGWFIAALVVSRAPGELRCPRCGTANDRLARSCVACELSFQ